MDENNNGNALNTDQNGSPAQTLSPPGAKTYTFRNTYLGLGLMGAVLLAIIITGSLNPHFLDGRNLLNILVQSVPLFAVAFAAALTSRAKGPDLSVGVIAGISSLIIALVTNETGSWVIGLLAAVAVCAVVGAVNGALIVFLKIPSVILTIATSAAIPGLLVFLLGINGVTQEQLSFSQLNAMDMRYGAYIFIPVTFIIAFVIIRLTKLGVPFYKRDKKTEPIYILAYIGSAVIGAIIGLFIVARVGIADMSNTSGNAFYILFVYAAVISTRAADNKTFPAVYALAPALAWGMLTNTLAMAGLNSYFQQVIICWLSFVFLVVAYICKYERKPKAPVV